MTLTPSITCPRAMRGPLGGPRRTTHSEAAQGTIRTSLLPAVALTPKEPLTGLRRVPGEPSGARVTPSAWLADPDTRYLVRGMTASGTRPAMDAVSNKAIANSAAHGVISRSVQ